MCQYSKVPMCQLKKLKNMNYCISLINQASKSTKFHLCSYSAIDSLAHWQIGTLAHWHIKTLAYYRIASSSPSLPCRYDMGISTDQFSNRCGNKERDHRPVRLKRGLPVDSPW